MRLLLPLVLVTSACHRNPREAVPLDLHFLDVGQGDCALVGCPDGTWHMFDCGSGGTSERGYARQSVHQILNGSPLDTVVISHPDADHYALLPFVLDEVPFDRVLLGGLQDGKEVDAEVLDWLEARAPVERLPEDAWDAERDPNTWLTCGDADVWVTAANVPTSDDNWAANSSSIVLRLEAGGPDGPFSALLTGDATFDSEQAMLGRYDADFLDVDLLRIGHHGSAATSSSEAFLDAVLPDLAVVSAGQNLGYQHPRCSVLDSVLQSPALDDAACHRVTCGAPEDATLDCDGAPRSEWCTFETTQALYNTYDSGNVHISWTGTATVETDLGLCD